MDEKRSKDAKLPGTVFQIDDVGTSYLWKNFLEADPSIFSFLLTSDLAALSNSSFLVHFMIHCMIYILHTCPKLPYILYTCPNLM